LFCDALSLALLVCRRLGISLGLPFSSSFGFLSFDVRIFCLVPCI
jgi:hypothetical protein